MIGRKHHYNRLGMAAGAGFLVGWLATWIYPEWPYAVLILGLIGAWLLACLIPLLIIAAAAGGRR